MGIELRSISNSKEGITYAKDLDMTIEDGTFLALVAPTGTGKTTLLRVISGIQPVDKGQIFVDGEDVTGVHVRDRNIAMVYQQFINYPSFTVYKNIASPLQVAGVDKKTIDARVRMVADQLQISEFLQRLPQELSGGQQQRVAIARALSKDARIVLMDEPLGNLDYKLREDLRVELKNLAAERDSIFIYATPEPIDALMMASHVAVMYDGRIIQYGELEDVYMRPSHIKSGEYFSDPPMNFMEGEIRGDTATISNTFSIPIAQMEADLPDGPYTFGIRPHHISLETEVSGENMVKMDATVNLAEIVGSDTTLHLTHNDMDFIAIAREMRHFDLDERINVLFDPRQIHIFDTSTGDIVLNAVEARQ